MIYLNDIDPNACNTLRAMMEDGLIAEGDVDDRSVADVRGRDLAGYNRVHLFAGIGGFEIAAGLADWPDDRQLWTGGFPCQPFSAAGRKGGTADDRYLWPEFHRLLRDCRPEFVLIENVPGIDGETDMVLDRVCADLESIGYEAWPCEIPACAVDAAHLRNRVWIVAHCGQQPGQQISRSTYGHEVPHERRPQEHLHGPSGHDEGAMGDCQKQRRDIRKDNDDGGRRQRAPADSSETAWIACHDGKFRRIPLGLLDPDVVLADGLPSRRVALHGLGNAIVPQIAAEIMKAMLRAA